MTAENQLENIINKLVEIQRDDWVKGYAAEEEIGEAIPHLEAAITDLERARQEAEP